MFCLSVKCFPKKTLINVQFVALVGHTRVLNWSTLHKFTKLLFVLVTVSNCFPHLHPGVSEQGRPDPPARLRSQQEHVEPLEDGG